MTSKYLIDMSFKEGSVQLITTYKGGNLARVDRKRGFLPDRYWSRIMRVIPLREVDVQAQIDRLSAKGQTYEPISSEKDPGLFRKCMDAYTAFYRERADMELHIGGREGKAMKNIIARLRKISADDVEALATWNQILDGWMNLDPFYRRQMELHQINGNFNTIIRTLKHGKSGHKGGTSRSVADDLRRGVTG